MKKKLITIALSSALALSTVSVGISEDLVQASNSSGSQHVKGVENFTIAKKQSQTNPGEYVFTAINPQEPIDNWLIDGHSLGIAADSITYKFTTPGSHKVEARWVKKLPYTGGIKIGSGSTTVNVKIIGPTQATWIVDPSIGTTATAIAAKFNSASEKEFSKARFTVTAEGNQLHFVCKPGTFMTPAAANLVTGSETNANKASGTIIEDVPGVEYVTKGAYKGSLFVLTEGYGQATNAYKYDDAAKSYEWSINCLKPQATQATYTVDPSTGATAAGIVKELYNHKTDDPEVPGIGEGVASAVAKGNNIVYTCKPGYHISEVAANLPVGSQTRENGDSRPGSVYPVIDYDPATDSYGAETFRSSFASNGHKAPGGAHLWGVDCIK